MSIIVEIKVVPSSGRIGCKLEGPRLKCYLKAAPEKGKANNELVRYMAKKLGLKWAQVVIVSGATSKLKRLKIDDEISFEELCLKLGIEKQMKLF